MLKTLAERFDRFVEVIPFHDCWEWTGFRSEKGYGKIASGKRGESPRRAHRVAWEIANGSIPNGLHILHRCDNPSCVRPSHLFLGNDLENQRDRIKKGRGKRIGWNLPEAIKISATRRREKTHCKRGHLRTQENALITVRGKYVMRGCNECSRISASQRAQALKDRESK